VAAGTASGRAGVRAKAHVASFALLVVVALVGVVGSTPGSAVGAVPRQTTPWPGGTWQPDAPSYGMTVESHVAVQMSDGATLYADIGFPTDQSTGAKATGKFPVLLTQNPYLSTETTNRGPNEFFVSRGYIHAVVQIRGTQDTTGPGGKSVANDTFSPRETQDGVELVDWAAKLSGSDGKVGLYGCSQLGVVQLFTAAAVKPNSPLKAIVPACAYYAYDGQFAGGMPSQLVNLIKVSSTLAASLYGPKNNDASVAVTQALYDDIVASGPRAYNGKFWQQRSSLIAMPKIAKNNIPTLLWSGWKATDGPGSLYEYAALQNTFAGRPPFGAMSPKQKTTGRFQVIIGPWSHGQGLDDAIQLEWYDTWLKGVDTGIADTSTPMHLGQTTGDRWINAAAAPLTQTYTPMRLGASDALSTSVPSSPGTGQITWGPAETAGTSLSFTSEPATAEQDLIGPIAATIYAKSSTRQLQLTATLFDVAPDGTATELSNGTVVGSLRAVDKKASWYDSKGLMVHPVQPFKADQFAKANTSNRYDIAMTPTFAAIAPGHQLRLTLGTQPPAEKCALSLQTALGLPTPCLPTDAQKADLTDAVFTIEWGTSTPSSVNLPLVDPSTLTTAQSATTATSKNRVVPLDWGSTTKTK
jgi:predicted acyl esterase